MNIKLTLAVINLILLFSWMGGRVLQALVWRLLAASSMQSSHPIAIAAGMGQGIGMGFIGLGSYTVFDGYLMKACGWLLSDDF